MSEQGNLLKERQALETALILSGGENVLLTESRRYLLDLQPMVLLQKLKDRKVTAVMVLEAFQAKAIEETKRTNCVTKFIPEAKQWAKELDAKSGLSSLSEMPLFGIPLSIKDLIGVKGIVSTLGLAHRVNNPSQDDALFVKLFKKLGAVPFVMTNIPQTGMSFNCSNPLFGETLNPYDHDRACGGSSGGEGALIGGGGSILGLGSDIAGSLRVPAHFCGIATIKPTSQRISKQGIVPPYPPLVGVHGVIGVMGKNAEIVVEATKALFSEGMNQFSSTVPPVVWRDYLFSGTIERPLKLKLTIGWYTSLGLFDPTPGVERSIMESVSVLENLGHELVQFTPFEIKKATELYWDFVLADGGKYITELLEGEAVDPSIEFYMDLACAAGKQNGMTKSELKEKYGDYVSEIKCSIDNVAKLWQKQGERLDYINKFQQSWEKANLDLVVGPVWPVPALKKGFNSSFFATAIYTMIYNLLDFPCGVVPFTKETEEDQEKLKNYEISDCRLRQLIKDNTTGSTGMPLGVQFVAPPFCEEVLCRIMMEFSKEVDFKI